MGLSYYASVSIGRDIERIVLVITLLCRCRYLHDILANGMTKPTQQSMKIEKATSIVIIDPSSLINLS